MRTLLPLLLLAVTAYAGWYFWGEYTARPLQTDLLRIPAAALRQVTVREQDERFRFFRAADDWWVVARDHQEIYDRSAAVAGLMDLLTGIRTDSVLPPSPGEPDFVLEFKGLEETERVALRFPPAGPPRARLLPGGAAFAISPTLVPALRRGLRFASYRGGRTLRLAAERVDSVVVSRGDSLRYRTSPSDLPLLLGALLTPAPAPDADYFDEVADRDKRFATLTLFAGGAPHLIAAYRNSAWPRPLVIVGEDFPRRAFGLDSLPGAAAGFGVRREGNE